MDKKIFFISDAHLGIDIAGAADRELVLVRFLKSITPCASHLFILGDLFDFWIEYRHAIRPDYVPIIHQFMAMRESGVEIHYLAGNHDFALGPFLHSVAGIHIHTNGAVRMELHGKMVYMHHGDGLLPGDRIYRILRPLLRSRINQFLYKLIHPTIGVALGIYCSGSSRKHTFDRYTPALRIAYWEVAKRLFAQGNDAVLVGHIHHTDHYQCGRQVYIGLGDWITRFSYAVMDDGVLTLNRYVPGGEPLAHGVIVEK